MKFKLTDKKIVAKETGWFKFESKQDFDFKPGQFAFIEILRPKFDDPRGNFHYFSINNSPFIKRTIEITTRLRETPFKQSLKAMSIGEEINTIEIGGSFVLPEETEIPLVFIAGGIGITPFLSMIRFAFQNRTQHKIKLIYLNHNKEETAYYDELRKHNTIFYFTGEQGYLTSEKMKEIVPDYLKFKFMLAGPPGMVKAIKGELDKLKIEASMIKSESFSGY